MKTISRTMMTAVLLVAVLTASAQGVTKGSYNPIVGTGEIFYSFSGGKVIEKSAFKEQLSAVSCLLPRWWKASRKAMSPFFPRQ